MDFLKKFIITVFVSALLTTSAWSAGGARIYSSATDMKAAPITGKTGCIGAGDPAGCCSGAGTGTCTSLENGDISMVGSVALGWLVYIYDIDATTATNPPHGYRPDDYTTQGYWDLISSAMPISNVGDAEFDTLITDINAINRQKLVVTTEDDVTVGAEVTSSIIMLTGDDDADHDTLTLQDGVTTGTILTFIVEATCDDTDNLIIDAETDSTCTACPTSGIFTFDDPGDLVTLFWSDSAWFYLYSRAVD